MPMYNVEHSFPLSKPQKADLAERITKLHATAFTTPSVFVQVKFHQEDASSNDHFVGGKIQETSTNRILAYVRSSSSRTKEQFDKLAKDIEDAWYIAVGEKADGIDEEDLKRNQKNLKESSAKEKEAKDLLSIAFIPGLSGREKGFVIPEAGKEEAWIKELRKEFEQKAELGDEGIKDMLEEINTRDDLKSWRA